MAINYDGDILCWLHTNEWSKGLSPVKTLFLANPNAYQKQTLAQFELDQIILIWKWPYPFIRSDLSFKNVLTPILNWP